MVTAKTGFTLRERAPAGGVDGDAGPKTRRRHRAVQRHERLQPRRRRGRRPATNQRPLREHTRARKHRISPSVGRQRVSVATCGGSGRSGQQRKATQGKAAARRGRGL
jgi:hypothetical protein